MIASRIAWSILVPFCLALAVVAVVTIVRHNTAAREGSGDVVVMQSLAYSPRILSVQRGTHVVFDNRDVAPHTVTADDGSIDSGTVDPGETFRVIANRSFSYFCAIHPDMTAEVRVGG